MKFLSPSLTCALFVGSLASPSLAGDSSKGSVAPIVPTATCSDRALQPLFSRYARTATEWTLRAGYRNFRDMELQEIDSFDGSSYDIELTVPLSERLQLRFYYPVHTKGDATDVATDNDVDVDGYGGLLDFPSLILDYQFKQSNGIGDSNMAFYAGIGYVSQYLEVEDKTTGQLDRLNHRGAAVLFGLKADKQFNNCISLVGNVGGRYYWESDDIHPGGGSDKFFLLDLSAAVIYAPAQAWVYPAVELVYQGDLSDYSSLQVVPQVIVPLGSKLDVNAGVALGFIDAPETEARIQLNYRF